MMQRQTFSAFLKILFPLALVMSSFLVEAQQRYWNENLPLTSFRLPPPPIWAKIEYEDLDGDGDPDLLKTVSNHDTPVLWIDDDDDMKEGDWSGDTDSDCLLIDRNKDGKYGSFNDLIIDWSDEDGDGKADLQIIADQLGQDINRWHGSAQYMVVIDTDNDNVLNYINYDTFELECWDHSGTSRFFEDYRGHTMFLKVHGSTFSFEEPTLNWENPFLFYDPDNDGHTEFALRMIDTKLFKSDNPPSFPDDPSKITKEMRNIYVDGTIDQVMMGIDMDNDNAAGTEFDFDMSILLSGKGFDYTDQIHEFKSLKGLAGTDKYFYDARLRQLDKLIYPDHETSWDLTFEKGEWEEAWLVFDEDDDCHRWERVEYYEPEDLYKAGARKGGLDNHPQADVSGDRGEWDEDFSGEGNLYIGAFDGKIHLHGAEWGAWRIDQDAKFYQGWQGWRNGSEPVPDVFPIIRYEDKDKNGFFDFIQYDLDGDQSFELEINLKDLGVEDAQPVIILKDMAYENFEALFKKASRKNWQRAQKGEELAESLGLDTSWYANFKQACSIREQYHFGYWLNFYLFMDMRDLAMRTNDQKLLRKIEKAYYSGDWNILK